MLKSEGTLNYGFIQKSWNSIQNVNSEYLDDMTKMISAVQNN